MTEATTTAKGKSYRYAYLRYDVWDEAMGRMRPRTLATFRRYEGQPWFVARRGRAHVSW